MKYRSSMVLKGKAGRFHSSRIYTNLQVLYKGSPICRPVNNIDLSQVGMIGLSMMKWHQKDWMFLLLGQVLLQFIAISEQIRLNTA